MLLIPKGNRYFRGIGIVEFLWKSLSGVINWRIRAVVQFHDVLHGFWACRGMGKTSLEAKMIQQLMDMRE